MSRPYHSNGYAIRSHYLMKALRENGWDIQGFTRAGYPIDRSDFSNTSVRFIPQDAVIDGIHYRFSPGNQIPRKSDEQEYHEHAVTSLIKQCEKCRPSIIHCASNYQVGLAGIAAARYLGIPSIYEIRGLWHLTRASKKQHYEGSDHYRLCQQLEVQAAKNADHVLSINGAIRDIFINEGVLKEKITIVPNAVDIDRFSPQKPDNMVISQMGFQNKTIIGFIGSITEYEGLDYLIDTVPGLRSTFKDTFRFLIVGNGSVFQDLKNKVKRLRITDLFYFAGQVPHEEVLRYYSIIDVAVFPRKGSHVCEVVSPIKPLEPMAMRKAVIASDVKPLAEIIEHGKTGLLHKKDDISILQDELSKIIDSQTMRNELGMHAREWILANRAWPKVSKSINSVYKKLLN